MTAESFVQCKRRRGQRLRGLVLCLAACASAFAGDDEPEPILARTTWDDTSSPQLRLGDPSFDVGGVNAILCVPEKGELVFSLCRPGNNYDIVMVDERTGRQLRRWPLDTSEQRASMPPNLYLRRNCLDARVAGNVVDVAGAVTSTTPSLGDNEPVTWLYCATGTSSEADATKRMAPTLRFQGTALAVGFTTLGERVTLWVATTKGVHRCERRDGTWLAVESRATGLARAFPTAFGIVAKTDADTGVAYDFAEEGLRVTPVAELGAPWSVKAVSRNGQFALVSKSRRVFEVNLSAAIRGETSTTPLTDELDGEESKYWFSSDGTMIAEERMGQREALERVVWRRKDHERVAVWAGDFEGVRDMSFGTGNGVLLATDTLRTRIRRFDVARQTEMRTAGHTYFPRVVRFSEDGTSVVSASDDRICVWPMSAGGKPLLIDTDDDFPTDVGLIATADGAQVVAAMYRKSGQHWRVNRWAAADGKLLESAVIKDTRSVALARSGRLAIILNDEFTQPPAVVQCRDVLSGRTSTLFESEREGHSLAVSHSGATVVLRTVGGGWIARTASEKPIQIDTRGPVQGEWVTEDGSTLVSAYDVYSLWDVRTPALRRRIAVKGNTQQLYSAGSGGVLVMQEPSVYLGILEALAEPEPRLRVIRLHSPASCAEWSGATRRLAVGHCDGTVTVWRGLVAEGR